MSELFNTGGANLPAGTRIRVARRGTRKVTLHGVVVCPKRPDNTPVAEIRLVSRKPRHRPTHYKLKKSDVWDVTLHALEPVMAEQGRELWD